MENASQALLIAGGVLLAILTISAFMLMLNNATTIKSAEQNSKEIQRIVKWNAEWEAYNKKILYGTDVVTVVNKANQNNEDYPMYKVEIKILNEDGTIYKKSDMELKDRMLSCTKIETNNDTGRINYMEFKIIE